jgi:hypothetical protein
MMGMQGNQGELKGTRLEVCDGRLRSLRGILIGKADRACPEVNDRAGAKQKVHAQQAVDGEATASAWLLHVLTDRLSRISNVSRLVWTK